MFKNKKIIAFVLIVLLISIVILFQNLNITGKMILKENAQTIDIGVIGTLTGPGQYFGEEQLRGLTIALEEINLQGGIDGRKVNLVIEDSKTDIKEAINAANKLIRFDNVKYIIGDTWNFTTYAILPIINENQVLLISTTENMDQSTADDYYFRLLPKVSDLVEEIARYMYYQEDSKRVGIVQDLTDFGKEHTTAFVREFKRLGGEVIIIEEAEIFSKDTRTQLLKVKEKNPDTIFSMRSGTQTGLLMKEPKELGIEVKWFSQYGTQNNPIIKSYGEVIEGIFFPYPKEDFDAGFEKKYRDKYNEIPNIFAANAYDALYILKEAIESVGENTDKVKEYLLSLEYNGASGKISFDQFGDVKKEIVIKSVKNEEFVLVE
jgi:branched-chain amino acid transport system substrate-binding protein